MAPSMEVSHVVLHVLVDFINFMKVRKCLLSYLFIAAYKKSTYLQDGCCVL